jgi:hypothetical protein
MQFRAAASACTVPLQRKGKVVVQFGEVVHTLVKGAPARPIAKVGVKRVV